jgi:hypothetical protein
MKIQLTTNNNKPLKWGNLITKFMQNTKIYYLSSNTTGYVIEDLIVNVSLVNNTEQFHTQRGEKINSSDLYFFDKSEAIRYSLEK